MLSGSPQMRIPSPLFANKKYPKPIILTLRIQIDNLFQKHTKATKYTTYHSVSALTGSNIMMRTRFARSTLEIAERISEKLKTFVHVFEFLASIAAIVGATGLIFVYQQLKIQEEEASGNIQNQIYEKMVDIDKFFIEHPDARDAIYNGKECNASDYPCKTETAAAAELMLDFFSQVMISKDKLAKNKILMIIPEKPMFPYAPRELNRPKKPKALVEQEKNIELNNQQKKPSQNEPHKGIASDAFGKNTKPSTTIESIFFTELEFSIISHEYNTQLAAYENDKVKFEHFQQFGDLVNSANELIEFGNCLDPNPKHKRDNIKREFIMKAEPGSTIETGLDASDDWISYMRDTYLCSPALRDRLKQKQSWYLKAEVYMFIKCSEEKLTQIGDPFKDGICDEKYIERPISNVANKHHK